MYLLVHFVSSSSEDNQETCLNKPTMETLAISDLNILSIVFFTCWGVLSVFLSLFGNTFVLVASKHGKAIKLDRVSIVLIENLAVTDIGTSLFVILAPLLWLCTQKSWSDSSKYVNTQLFNILWIPSLFFMGAGSTLVSFLNCCKLFSLLFPLRARTWRYRDGYKTVAIVWIFLSLATTGNWIATQQSYTILAAISVSGTLLLLMVVLTTTFGLLVKVHKARGLRKQGVFSIILVSVVFFVCYTPMAISNLLECIHGNTIGQQTLSRVITACILYISCFSNPLIYYLALQSFKEYTDMVFRKYLKYFRRNPSVQSNHGS